MMHYQENRMYSPLFDGDVARISMWDRHGSEFFCLIPAGYGAAYRDRRDACLEAIETAIAQRRDPGEVRFQ